MLSTAARSRLAVVLVGARNPQNIGSVARAMQDFGFSDLRVVNDFAAPFEGAQLEAKSAVGAGQVMRAARRFDQLSEAIEDCSLVVGTTAIGDRGLRQSVRTLQEGAPEILAALVASEAVALLPQAHEEMVRVPRVALLFGSEKTGLTKDQLSHCSSLVTIPLFMPAERHLSMNLGQAVAVCLYELSRQGFEGSRELPVVHAIGATAGDHERLTALLLETMEASDYARRFPANARPVVVRPLAQALCTSHEAAATWMGLFKLILRSIRLPSSGSQ